MRNRGDTDARYPLLIKYLFLHRFSFEDNKRLIHYSCDRCKRPINPKTDLRYVVRLETQAMMDLPDFQDSEDERDHLLEIEELLDELGEIEASNCSDDYKKLRYDLCSNCHEEFIKNPISSDRSNRVGFSQN
jgi:hypothetical protein